MSFLTLKGLWKENKKKIIAQEGEDLKQIVIRYKKKTILHKNKNIGI